MPGTPVGTIFAELDLDASRYTNGQQRLLKDATTVTLNIEKNFQNLGVKSAAEMDLMRAKITNSFDMIKNSAKATANDIIRAEEAKNAKLKALNEQQFGHQTTMLESLKNNWIKAAAVIGASMIAAQKGWAMLGEAAGYDEQAGLLNNLTAKYKMTADSILSEMKRASDGMVANSDLMRVALGGIAKGLTPQQLIDLSDAAKILSDTVGTTATQALNDLTQSLETGRVKGLKNYGGATVELRDYFGELETQLTATEKAQAMYSLIMIHATKLQSEQTGEIDQTADKLERLEASYKNITLSVSRAFKTAIVGVDEFITRYGKGSVDPLRIGANFLQSLVFDKKGMSGPGVYDVPDIGSGSKKDDPAAAYKAQIEELKKLLQARNNDKKTVKDHTDVVRKAADEEAKLQAFKVDLYIKDEARKWEELEKYEKEYAEEQKRIDDEVTKLAQADFDYLVSLDNERAANEQKNASDRLKAERDIYEDLRGYEGSYYESSKKMIDEQAEAYRKLGVDQVAVIQWVTKEYERAEIKKLKASGKFFDGVKAYLKELKDEQTTWGEAGYEIVKSFADNSKSTLSTVLFDGAKGQMKSFEDYFQSFTDTILKKFTDMVAQMIVEWMMLEGMKSFKSLVGGLGEMIGGGVFHMGGIVGQIGTPTRMIPAAAFAGAPRLHNGLAADEFPAILQRGERVLSKREVAQGGGNNISISMPISITGGGGKKWADSLRGEIRDLVDRRVKDLI